MYRLRPAEAITGKSPRSAVSSPVHLLGSGAILREAMRAQELLAERFGVAAEVWSVTSYKELRREALAVEHWNRLHPTASPRSSYVERLLGEEKGIFIAATDYMKSLPEMITRWVPGGLTSLGTDGFGRSDNRPSLRRFFEMDAECIALAALHRLAQRGEIKPARVQKAIEELGIDPEKTDPVSS
jgi:pyruvate dehydrogenase E1 component